MRIWPLGCRAIDATLLLGSGLKLVSIEPEKPRFKFGSAKGKFVVPEDFNDPLPKEIEDLFYE